MKNKLFYIIMMMMLISCNQEKKLLNYSQKKANQFIDKYATKFLNDTALLKYNYDLRSQFIYEQNLNIYRVFTRKNEVSIICFSDSCKLSEPFNVNPLILLKGNYTLKQDSIFKEISYDSSIVEVHPFKFKPENYFNELKKRLNQYGVFAFYEARDKSYIRVYLSVQYYLIKSNKINEDIKDDEIIKSYKDNWYFVKMKKTMDLG